MMQLGFSGWFQCRLATDPDPTDEPRGISGSTFALPGESDFDRIIRTQPAGTTPRSLGPEIGVSVKSVIIDGTASAQHALKDAPVTLLSDPVFEGRNGLASEDTEEPIFPFHIRIEANGIRLEREFRELDTGAWRFQKSNGVEANSAAMGRAGIDDPAAYVANRQAGLEKQLAAATDPHQKLQLQERLRHLTIDGFGPVPLFVGLRYRYRLEGPWFEVRDKNGLLGGTVDGSPWLLNAWVGCWDGEALCGFMEGDLTLPFLAKNS
jgi:hypothetical protein